MCFIKKDQSGMTLVELIIVLFISTLVISGAYGMFSLVLNNYMLSEEKTREFEQLRELPRTIGMDVRRASSSHNDGPVEILDDGERMNVNYLDEDGEEQTIIYEFDDDEGELERDGSVIMDDFHMMEFEDITEDLAVEIAVERGEDVDEWTGVVSDWGRKLIKVTIQLEEDQGEKTFRFLTRSGYPAEKPDI